MRLFRAHFNSIHCIFPSSPLASTLQFPPPMLLLRAATSSCTFRPLLLLHRCLSSPAATPPMTWGVCDYGRLGHGGASASSAWRWAAVDALEPRPVALSLPPSCAVTAASCGEACVSPHILSPSFLAYFASDPSPFLSSSHFPATHCSWTRMGLPGPQDSTRGSLPLPHRSSARPHAASAVGSLVLATQATLLIPNASS